MTGNGTGSDRRLPPSDGPNAVEQAQQRDPGTSGRSGRCICGQSPFPKQSLPVKPEVLAIALNANPACRWYRPFRFGAQRGDEFRITRRTEDFLDDWRNWPAPTDCRAKIREIAANPRPSDRDIHFGSRN